MARSWLHLPRAARQGDAPSGSPNCTSAATGRSASWRRGSARHDWLAGDAYSVADIALYAYTHVAHQGGFDLAPYPGIRAWLARVAARPGHVDIDWRP